MGLKALNNKQTEKIKNSLTSWFGINKFPLEEVIFFQRGDKKIFVVSPDLKRLDTFPPRPNSLGMYFAIEENAWFRLSLEGSQILGPSSKKNVIEINKKELQEWFNGMDLRIDSKEKGFVILKYREDYVGCGYVKEGKILNYIPKNRRVTDLF